MVGSQWRMSARCRRVFSLPVLVALLLSLGTMALRQDAPASAARDGAGAALIGVVAAGQPTAVGVRLDTRLLVKRGADRLMAHGTDASWSTLRITRPAALWALGADPDDQGGRGRGDADRDRAPPGRV